MDMFSHLTKMADYIARTMAYVGGATLIALIVMTCISIVGRSLVPFGFSPVKGDFEWIEIGVGFAIFAFLPWCQLQRGHAAVDLFEPFFPKAMNRVIDVIVDIGMFAAATIIAWRLWLGMLDKHRYGETTFILQFPVWTAYAAGLVGAVAFAVVSLYCVIRSGRRLAMPRLECEHVQH